MMTQLSISQARSRLTRLAGQLQKDHEAVEVTSRGKPVLAILPWDLYESLEETIEILDDEQLATQLKKSLAEVKKGRLIPWEKAKKDFRL
jgi:prevent-host-death family protein